jgi:hypothetical protein
VGSSLIELSVFPSAGAGPVLVDMAADQVRGRRALFHLLRNGLDAAAVVELTEIVAWENASSKINRAFRVPSQGRYERSAE